MPAGDHHQSPDPSPPTESTHRQDDARRLSFFTTLIATGLYSGYIPWASGTFGSLVGVLLYLIPGAEQTGTLSLLIIVGFFGGVVTSAQVALAEGHRLTKTATLAKATFQRLSSSRFSRSAGSISSSLPRHGNWKKSRTAGASCWMMLSPASMQTSQRVLRSMFFMAFFLHSPSSS
jgi:hypothetical protein